MNVFVLIGSVPYEGSDILGVYESFEDAENAWKSLRSDEDCDSYVYSVEEYVLGTGEHISLHYLGE